MITKQTMQEATEILTVVKPKMLNGCKKGKTMNMLTDSVADLLETFKLRERMRIGNEIKDQYLGFVPRPKTTFKNRFYFLFFGKFK